MRKRVLEILACPICKGDLKLESFEEEGDEVISGKLICTKCGTEYPIEEGIPNMLPPDLR